MVSKPNLEEPATVRYARDVVAGRIDVDHATKNTCEEYLRAFAASRSLVTEEVGDDLNT